MRFRLSTLRPSNLGLFRSSSQTNTRGEKVDMVPGMTQYGESQEFSQVGIAVENDDDLPQPMDWEQESTESNTDFSPTTK